MGKGKKEMRRGGDRGGRERMVVEENGNGI